jgi:methylated-DNA-[protein]-cysteine S-methyltransferase
MNKNKTTCRFSYETFLGLVTISANDRAIIGLQFGTYYPSAIDLIKETPIIKQAAVQLKEYLAGARKKFTLKLEQDGTDFQLATWQAMQQIPYGETRSYGEIARAIKHPHASRAVGGACNKNSIPIFIPCHRIIGSNGDLVGYDGGIAIKKRLLLIEGALS